MADDFETHQPSLTAPAGAAQAITPHNTTPLSHVTRAIYVGGTGDLRITLVSGDTVTLTGVQGGTAYPLRATHVLATGTTATGLVGLR